MIIRFVFAQDDEERVVYVEQGIDHVAHTKGNDHPVSPQLFPWEATTSSSSLLITLPVMSLCLELLQLEILQEWNGRDEDIQHEYV